MTQEETILVFPPHLGRLSAPAALKVGDRVHIARREQLGTGTVISFDPDERLVKLSIGGGDGWWNRQDLVKEN